MKSSITNYIQLKCYMFLKLKAQLIPAKTIISNLYIFTNYSHEKATLTAIS